MDLGELSAGIFSPFKVAYYGFLFGLWKDKISLGSCPRLLFFLATILFLAGEILHNDYYRIVLNHRAEGKGLRRSEKT